MLATQKITVALAADANFFANGLKLSLQKNADINIVGEVANCVELNSLVLEKQPNIVLIDLNMDGCGETVTINAIREIVKHHSQTSIIVLSHSNDEPLILNMLKAGIAGCLVKNVSDNELYIAIAEVQNGQTYFSKEISKKIVQIAKKPHVFTGIEEKIINCICSEMTSKEIAEQLCISYRTVEGHRCNIMKKMEAKGLAGIVIYAIQHGIFKLKKRVETPEKNPCKHLKK